MSLGGNPAWEGWELRGLQRARKSPSVVLSWSSQGLPGMRGSEMLFRWQYGPTVRAPVLIVLKLPLALRPQAVASLGPTLRNHSF